MYSPFKQALSWKRGQFGFGVATAAFSLTLSVLIGESHGGVPEPGPRGPAGPDVPLSAAEAEKLAARVTVEGFTGEAVVAAVSKAQAQGVDVVYFPEGSYTLSNITLPGGLTLLGAGSKTLISTVTDGTLFEIGGSNVRITRMKIAGGNPTFDAVSDSLLFWVKGAHKNIRIDHCEITAFARSMIFDGTTTAQVDHSLIHHNPYSGLGYGPAALSDSRVLVCDNIFHSNRHSVTSNYGGPHYTFRHNHILDDKDCKRDDNLSQCDVHADAKTGTFVVEYSVFENLKGVVGAWAAQGVVRGNIFKNLGYAIWITSGKEHEVRDNTFENVTEPYKGDVSGEHEAPRPLNVPYLKEMNEAGVMEVIETETTSYYTAFHPCCPQDGEHEAGDEEWAEERDAGCPECEIDREAEADSLDSGGTDRNEGDLVGACGCQAGARGSNAGTSLLLLVALAVIWALGRPKWMHFSVRSRGLWDR